MARRWRVATDDLVLGERDGDQVLLVRSGRSAPRGAYSFATEAEAKIALRELTFSWTYPDFALGARAERF